MNKLLMDIREARIDANEKLFERKLYYMVDEIGVKFNSVEEAENFIGDMEDEALKHFNSSATTITLRDGDEVVDFGLQLDFLRIPGAMWRIEVMYVTDGPAPLHDDLPSGSIVHTAFKVPWNHFDIVCEELPEPRGICTNDYGKFGYFGNVPYLKPRTVR